MSTRRKPVVGEPLIRVSTGNLLHGGRKQEVLAVHVASVGKKYFTTEATPVPSLLNVRHYPRQVTHHIDTWEQKTEYCRDWILYESMQEFLDASDASRIRAEVRKLFGDYGARRLTVDQLRRIWGIVEEGRP